jgi:hypothetical protein
MESFVKNKRIIIVGPSQSTLIHLTKEFVDSHDIVVRVNASPDTTLIHGEKIGYRCDILYHCLNEDIGSGGFINTELLKKLNTKFLIHNPKIVNKKAIECIPDNVNINKINMLSKFLNIKMINPIFYNNFSNKINTRPNTGFIAIFDLLRYNPKEIYITGYTFSMDGYISGYKNDKLIERSKKIYKSDITKIDLPGFNSKRHIKNNMVNFLKKSMKNDKRIKVDNILKKILSLDNLNTDKETLEYIFN